MYFDPCAFTPPPERTIGNLGRNTVIMPGRAIVDLSLAKGVQVREGMKLEFRAEGFNIFNRVNLGGPDRNVFTYSNTAGFVPSPTAGEITRIQGTARQVQMDLKLTF